MQLINKVNFRRPLKPRKIVINAVWCLVMSVFAVVLMFPFVFMLNKSFMSGTESATLPIKFFPSAYILDAYKTIFTNGSYMRWTLNTLVIVVFNMIAIPLSASLVAYGFAKTKFFGKNALFAIMLTTLLLPAMVIQIPQYIMFSTLGWADSILPLTVPNILGGGAINIFLLRQFMRGIPNELDNAARIDGAGAFKRYMLICLPLCKPILIYIMVTVFNGYWSDFYGPLIYLKSEEQYTLAIGIFKDSITNSSVRNVPERMAAGVFMTLFPTVLFFAFQKQLIEGVMVSGLKG